MQLPISVQKEVLANLEAIARFVKGLSDGGDEIINLTDAIETPILRAADQRGAGQPCAISGECAAHRNEWHCGPLQLSRSTTAGSSSAALRAGNHPAIAATITSSRPATAKVAVSRGGIW